MIEISADTACMLYVGALVLLLITVWVHHAQKAKKREIVKLTAVHVTCEYCSHAYMIEAFTPFHRCPHCHCLNKIQD